MEKDLRGNYHFNGNFNNAKSLEQALKALPEKYDEWAEKDSKLLLNLFENTFNHRYFTGRSGTFFGYEGLGSIYWHMNSKLLLAAQECYFNSINAATSDPSITQALQKCYFAIKEGIGIHKNPADYGAFPIDPYSHTPKGKGAQQPGMTGQVKEDILCRIGELGVRIRNGEVHFNNRMIPTEDYLKKSAKLKYYTISGDKKELQLEMGSIAFLYCQTPIIYMEDDTNNISFKHKETDMH
jgi:hypothetical protein